MRAFEVWLNWVLVKEMEPIALKARLSVHARAVLNNQQSWL